MVMLPQVRPKVRPILLGNSEVVWLNMVTCIHVKLLSPANFYMYFLSFSINVRQSNSILINWCGYHIKKGLFITIVAFCTLSVTDSFVTNTSFVYRTKNRCCKNLKLMTLMSYSSQLPIRIYPKMCINNICTWVKHILCAEVWYKTTLKYKSTK